MTPFSSILHITSGRTTQHWTGQSYRLHPPSSTVFFPPSPLPCRDPSVFCAPPGGCSDLVWFSGPPPARTADSALLRCHATPCTRKRERSEARKWTVQGLFESWRGLFSLSLALRDPAVGPHHGTQAHVFFPMPLFCCAPRHVADSRILARLWAGLGSRQDQDTNPLRLRFCWAATPTWKSSMLSCQSKSTCYNPGGSNRHPCNFLRAGRKPGSPWTSE